jgi:hypothetical protein
LGRVVQFLAGSESCTVQGLLRKSWNIDFCPGRAGADAADDERLEFPSPETMQAFEDALACASHGNGSQCHGPTNDARIIICIWPAISATCDMAITIRSADSDSLVYQCYSRRHCPASCRVDCHGSNRATMLQTLADSIILKAPLVYSCHLSRISYP